jgi:pimeloyl-ACP methyl ester carboxylesterase
MTAAFHEINSAQIYCMTEGSGVPVVLLHGFGLDQRMWDDQAAMLAERFFAIRYDLRGYGRSSVPTEQPYAHADDLYALLSNLDAKPAHVIGLSNGGRHAVRFALAYPQALRSLTLVGSVLDGHAWSPEWRAMWNLVDSKAKSGDLIGAKRLWLDHPLFGPAREQAGVAAHLREMVQDYSGWHWLHADPGVAPDPPAINRLDMIHVPTLVVVGERDLPDILSIANALTSGINGADQVAIPDVGHMTNMEAPAKFNDLLLNFLTS